MSKLPAERLPLAPRQEQALSVYWRRRLDGELPPSIREVAQEMGVSFSTAYEQVNALVAKGYLVRKRANRWRNVDLPTGTRVRREDVVKLLEHAILMRETDPEYAVAVRVLGEMIKRIQNLPEAP